MMLAVPDPHFAQTSSHTKQMAMIGEREPVHTEPYARAVTQCNISCGFAPYDVASAPMDQDPFAVIAEVLASGYLEALSYSRQFQEQHGSPPTILAKSHHLRSVVQAQIQEREGLELDPAYIEFGRVEIIVTSGTRYVLRSDASLAVEQMFRQQEALFDSNAYIRSDRMILVYGFEQDGVTLCLAGAIRRPIGRRLFASGEPAFVGRWPYDQERSQAFDQDESRDVFGDLGNVDMDLGDELS